MPRQDQLTGAAAEHLTAAILCRLGWAPSLTHPGYEGIDILAVHHNCRERMIQVQVKGATAGNPMWIKVTPERPHAAEVNAWCVFVSFGEEPTARPNFYVLPLQVVHVFAWAGVVNSIAKARERGRESRNPKGTLKPRDFFAYHERWDLLDHPEPQTLPYDIEGGFWQWLEVAGALPSDITPPRRGSLPPTDSDLASARSSEGA